MNDLYNFDAIEDYLLGRMTDEARAAFEAEMAKNPELAAQTARQRQEHRVMELMLEDPLRAKLERWKALDPPPGQGADFFTRRRLLLFSASIVCLLAALYWFLNRPEQTPPDPARPDTSEPEQPVVHTPRVDTPPQNRVVQPDIKQPQAEALQRYRAIAASFPEPLRYGEGLVRQGDPGSDAFAQALKDLENKQFRKGLAFLRTVPPADPHFPDAQYYQGLAWYEQGVFARAIPFLKTAADNTGYLYAEKAAWFLALAYLQNGQIERCKALASSIAKDEGHAAQEKAKKLLGRLE